MLNVAGNAESPTTNPDQSITDLDKIDLLRHKELLTFIISEMILLNLQAAKRHRKLKLTKIFWNLSECVKS